MPGNMGDPGCWGRPLARLSEITHADVHKIANDLLNTIKKSIGKWFTFMWGSYVHKFEQFDRGEVV